MSIIYTVATSVAELEQIITLQHNNLPVSISQEEKETEGFVSVIHDLTILKKMNNKQPHIIAKDGNKVIAYALCMLNDFKDDIEVLKPMFSKINDHLDSNTSYIVMGQVCIDKAYRKQGVFRGLYQTMKRELHKKYDFLITEVASSNTRSLHAHRAIGFETLLTHESDGLEWNIIHWNWA
ncbi:GNAT family N-acetyltransferase [Aquimarina sediminis]|uniref:GNAT family N-acetyltransferase n=1 Tax=Aquimarina sediminis TaxID=2070536 RepID=UPI000CA03D00|nr:GNAT family N-acetyltransferase [Aquimarina sediminis]